MSKALILTNRASLSLLILRTRIQWTAWTTLLHSSRFSSSQDTGFFNGTGICKSEHYFHCSPREKIHLTLQAWISDVLTFSNKQRSSQWRKRRNLTLWVRCVKKKARILSHATAVTTLQMTSHLVYPDRIQWTILRSNTKRIFWFTSQAPPPHQRCPCLRLLWGRCLDETWGAPPHHKWTDHPNHVTWDDAIWEQFCRYTTRLGGRFVVTRRCSAPDLALWVMR